MTHAFKSWPFPDYTLDDIDKVVCADDNISNALTAAILEATARARELERQRLARLSPREILTELEATKRMDDCPDILRDAACAAERTLNEWGKHGDIVEDVCAAIMMVKP